MRSAAFIALALALAGCASGPPAESDAGPGATLVEGWVVDETFTPVVGARASIPGLGLANVTDAEGHYRLAPPADQDVLMVFEAPGFVSQSRTVSASTGSHHLLNVTLARVPEGVPSLNVEKFEGILRCAATVVLQEDPNRPHQHQGVRCGDYLPEQTSQNIWEYEVQQNATGLVIEVAWEPQTELAQALVLKVEVAATGQILGFLEGTSIIRLQVASFPLAEILRAGQTDLVITIQPGAGTGSHEHGAAGLFLEQDFTIYATTFFNQPADPTYSVGQG